MLPEPKPWAIRLLLIVPLIGSQDIRCTQRPDIRQFEHLLQRLDFANDPFNVHPPISIAQSILATTLRLAPRWLELIAYYLGSIPQRLLWVLHRCSPGRIRHRERSDNPAEPTSVRDRDNECCGSRHRKRSLAHYRHRHDVASRSRRPNVTFELFLSTAENKQPTLPGF